MAKNYYEEIAEKFPELVNVEIKFDTKDPLHRYVLDHSVRLHPSQIQLIEATRNVKLRIMMSCSDQIQLLQNLVVAIGAKKIVDVGTFTGYSALSLALVLPPGSKVYTCDMHDTYLNIAQDAWKAGNVDNLIEFRQGPAVDTLKNLIETEGEGTFDFIYVDADKENYENYFELSLQLLRPGGIIAIDNVLWHGQVADSTVTDPATETMRKFNAKVAKDTRINISMLTTGDGTTLCFKK